MMKTDIKSAIDNRLASIEADSARRAGIRRRIAIEETKVMKKKFTLPLVVGLCVALFATAAVASTSGILAGLFSDGGDIFNKQIQSILQPVNAVYEGEIVRVTVQEAYCDTEGGSYAFSWSIDNLTDAENLYVIAHGPDIGGERTHFQSSLNVTDFFLGKGTTNAAGIGYLPAGDSRDCEFEIVLLRAIGSYEMAGDGGIESPIDWNAADYISKLTGGGSFELAETVKLNFELPQSDVPVYTVPEDKRIFTFGDCELHVEKALLTPATLVLELNLILAEPATYEDKKSGHMYNCTVTEPAKYFFYNTEYFFYSTADGQWDDFVHLDDGRWSLRYTFKALQLSDVPDSVDITCKVRRDGRPVDDILYDTLGTARLEFE